MQLSNTSKGGVYMASVRTEDQNKQIRDVMVEAAQIQLASLTATVKFWSSWAEATSKFSQSISQELAQLADRVTVSNDDLVRFADLNREYLRALSELPNTVATQFNGDLEKFRPKGPRTRSAKVKD